MNFTRNRGFVTSAEQARLADACVAIAGVGGDGGLVAETLARLGVGRFRLADPEVFEPENLNRQNGCTVHTIGQNKAEVIAEIIGSINPGAEVTVFPDGITHENVAGFVDGSTLVIDETEFTLHGLAVMLARACRPRGLPVLTGFNVAFGCIVTTFMPEGMPLEDYLGLPLEAELAEIEAITVDVSRWIPALPPYAHADVFGAVASGTISAPSVSPGVALAAGLVGSEAFNLLTGRAPAITAPRSIWLDALERRLEVIDDPQASFESTLAEMLRRTESGMNPPMDLT